MVIVLQIKIKLEKGMGVQEMDFPILNKVVM